MNIFIARHGQDEDNATGTLNGHRDKPLTELGRQQARTAGQKLKDNEISVIYSSPSKRTLETARIIAKEIGLEGIIIEPDLKERDYGGLTGKPVADIPKYATKTLQTDGVLYFLDAPGAESFGENLLRAKRILKKVKDKHPNDNVLLVTHGDMGKMIRAAYHNWSIEQGLKTPFFDNSEVLELAPKDIKE